MIRSWMKGLVVSSLASAALLAVACSGKQSESGGASGDAGAPLPDGDAGSAPARDASQSDEPSSDSPSGSDSPSSPDADADAAACPPLQGPVTTLDQEVANLCANPTGSPAWGVGPATTECDGLLAVYEQAGIDTQWLYLFDPTTRDLVESLWGVNSSWTCAGSATGVDLTASPGFQSCLGGALGGLQGGPPWHFQVACSACPNLGTSYCTSFAPPEDAASSAESFDQALAYACANPSEVDGAAVVPCVFSCKGFIGLAESSGSDTANVELFDPSTKQLVEVGGTGSGSPAVGCVCSSSGQAVVGCNVPQTVGGTGGCMIDPCGDAGTSAIDASSE